MTADALREKCLLRRPHTFGFERQLIDDILSYIERTERPRLGDEEVLDVLNRRPALAFAWLDEKGFGLNGGQQRKKANILGGL